MRLIGIYLLILRLEEGLLGPLFSPNSLQNLKKSLSRL